MIAINAAPEDVGLCSQRLARIRPWMQSYLDNNKLPGMLVLVARQGKVVFLETLGRRDVAADLPVTLDTLFRFYSMTKPITSVAAMMLYEQGHFQLDDPVSRYLPEFANMQVYAGGEGDNLLLEDIQQPITIQHLLTHTSGLIYGFLSDTPLSALYRSNAIDFNAHHNVTLAEMVTRLADVPLFCQPGSQWNYGVSTDVLGRLVEVISGQSLAEYFAEHIFTPLGMIDTAFHVSEEKRPRFAALYGPGENQALLLLDDPQTSHFVGSDVSLYSGGGGLVSTVSDYFRFTELLRRKGEFDGVRLLSRKTVEYMTCNHLPGDLAALGQPSFNETTFEGIGFGLGFSVTLDPAKAKVMGSAGEYAWGGFASTAFWIDPVEDMTVIFLTQLAPSSTYPIRRELRILTYQALID